MNKEQTVRMIEKIRNSGGNEDALWMIIGEIFEAGRQDMIKDIKITLADFEQTEAVEIVKENY